MHTTKTRMVEMFLGFLDLPMPLRYLILEYSGLARVSRRSSEFVIFYR